MSIYTVTIDGFLAHEPRLQSEEVRLHSPVLTQEDNMAASFAFTMLPEHARYNYIERLKSIVELKKGSDVIFRGRILDYTRGWENAKDFVCEGELAFLNDSVVRPYAYSGDIPEYLEMLISSHNAQVGADRQITLRDITVTDPNGYITRESSGYPNTLAEITEKLVGLLGGHLYTERTGGVTYLDYLIDSPQMSLQKIELGKNLLEFKEGVQSADIVTALIPLGAKLEDGTESRLTIADVNGGIDYVYDEDAVSRYGWIYAAKTWDDVHEAENLMAKAEQELAALVLGWTQIEVSAIDLSLVDQSIDDFRFLQYVRVVSPAHGFDDQMLVTRMITDLENPENGKLTIGRSSKGVTDYATASSKRIESIEATYVTNAGISDVLSNMSSVYSQITQTADTIMSTVADRYVAASDLTAILSELSTQLTQTSAGWEYTFNQLALQVTQNQSDTSATFSEQQRYIRFVDGAILIGEVGNDFVLKITNDRISFLDAGYEVAYVSDSKLRVTDAEITKSLTMGSFAFVPRDNGNLSLTKVS